MFLVLVGLTALLIGGLGVAGAVRAWLASRMPVIATLKCLGAPAQLVFRVHFAGDDGGQPWCLYRGRDCGAGTGARTRPSGRLCHRAAGDGPISGAIADCRWLWPVDVLLFALWPVAKAERCAAHLFRSLVEMPSGRPKPRYLVMSGAAIIGLAVLAFLATRNLSLTLGFVGGSIGSLLLLAGLGEVLMRVMRKLPAPGYVPARLALGDHKTGITGKVGDHRLGLGLSVLVAVSLSQAI